MENVHVPLLLLADDLVAVSANPLALQVFMRLFEAACQRWGLVISASKTECMAINPALQLADERWRRSIRCQKCHELQPEDSMVLCSCCDSGWHTACAEPPLSGVPEGDWLCPSCDAATKMAAETPSPGAATADRCVGLNHETPAHVTIAGQAVSWVKRFKYLGCQFSSDGGLDAELQYRCLLAENAFRRLYKPVWHQSGVRLSTKMRIYRCMVASVLLYGAHCWALTAAQLERLEKLQRRHLRCILGRKSWVIPPGPNVQPKRLNNKQLLSTCCEQPSIAARLLRQRGRWVGHILRMPGHRLAKQFFFGNLESHAPRQPSYGRRTLAETYNADISAQYPRHELRKLTPPCLCIAASNKNNWEGRFG